MEANKSIRNILLDQFGPGNAIVTGTAPGRVNLIGEHTDYNDGFVLPMAIKFHIQMAGRLRNDSLVQIYSADFDQTATFSLDQPLTFNKNYLWSNYIKGVLWALEGSGVGLQGMDLAFSGDLPQGGGLSSSAALEAVTALVALKLYGVTLATPQLALLCQKAENDFIGMKCGVMDQFASLAGSEGHALFLDCRTLDYDLIPMTLGEYRILICHSGVKHELVASEYNVRRQNCTDGVAVLKKHFPEITALRDVNLQMLERYRSEMTAEVYRRCFHVITENQRVLDSIEALRRGALTRFGELMNQSHDSQRDFFEVSCPEIDLLVDLARKVDGVLGARLTGGGFGGSTVNLIAADAIGRFEMEVAEVYRKKTGIEPQLFICTPCAGAKIDDQN